MARDLQYAESLGESSSTSSAFTKKVEVVFTPAANKAYLILGSALLQGTDPVNESSRTDLTVESAPDVYSDAIVRPHDAANYLSIPSVGIFPADATPVEEKFQIWWTTAV